MYTSLEQIQAEFPIGTIIKREIQKSIAYCPTEEIKNHYIYRYGAENVIDQGNNYIEVIAYTNDQTVDGYIYNGENWFPVKYEGMDIWKTIMIDLNPLEYMGYEKLEPDLEEEELALEQEEEEPNI